MIKIITGSLDELVEELEDDMDEMLKDTDVIGMAIQSIRDAVDKLEPNRELAMVKTKLDEAMMWMGYYHVLKEDKDGDGTD